jgi:site-specific DNA recombinase
MKTKNQIAEIINDENLLQFSKGEIKKEIFTKNAVIYTRVSSKEQADNNNSLHTQKKAIESFAQKNDFNLIEFFGGTYESAKTDGRKEFQRMLSYIKKNKNKITHILVYSLDRFSRTGGDAIKIAKDLAGNGIQIVSVTQMMDTSTPSGQLQQDINFIFSNYDNELRKGKCVDGMKDALLAGRWISGAPIGYERKLVDDEMILTISEKGEILKKAFYWKANESITNEEIVKRLLTYGLEIKRQNLSNIFRNVFYCGLIAHNLIPGQIIQGKHQPLITLELFKKVNGVLSKNPQGWKHSCDQEDIPLKGFLLCDNCGNPLTGYQASNRSTWYYKCRVKGCKVNKSATQFHEFFLNTISKFTLHQKYKPLLKKLLVKELETETEESVNNIKILESRLRTLNQDKEKLEYRFGIKGEVSLDLYNKLLQKLEGEILPVSLELNNLKENSSNIENSADEAINFVVNISDSWSFSDFSRKRKLQNLIFPDGMRYNKKNNTVRTFKFNDLLLWTACKQQDLEENKTGIPELNLSYAGLVEPEGFEPSSKQGIKKLSTCLAKL